MSNHLIERKARGNVFREDVILQGKISPRERASLQRFQWTIKLFVINFRNRIYTLGETKKIQKWEVHPPRKPHKVREETQIGLRVIESKKRPEKTSAIFQYIPEPKTHSVKPNKILTTAEMLELARS